MGTLSLYSMELISNGQNDLCSTENYPHTYLYPTILYIYLPTYYPIIYLGRLQIKFC